MVNTQLLENAITASGKKKGYLANRLKCSIQSFRLKATNKYDFTTTEIETLCHELQITKLTDKERIFFARKVDIMPTE